MEIGTHSCLLEQTQQATEGGGPATRDFQGSITISLVQVSSPGVCMKLTQLMKKS